MTVQDLVVRRFKLDDIFSAWAKLREACQVAAGQPVTVPIRHRSDVKLVEEFMKEVSETDKNGSMILVIPASELGLVKSFLDSNTGDERPVATRLESLEDMVKGVVDRLSRMETNQARAVRVPQSVVQPPEVVSTPGQAGQQETFAGVAAAGLSKQLLGLLGANRQRRDSLSVKRAATGEPRDQVGNTVDEEVCTEVNNRKKKKKEVSKGTATLESIPGVAVPLQPAYQHFVGNTPGNMEKETLELVFKELAVSVMNEQGLEGTLEIEQVNLMTKEENARTRVWRVVVPDKYRAVMQDDRMYPSGWHHREFEGHYRPPLSPQERTEREAKKNARRQNDNRLDVLLRNLAGSTTQQ